MSMKTKAFRYLQYGLSIGAVMTTLLLILMEGMNRTLLEMVIWLCASAGYGLVSLIFEAERHHNLTATAIHFVLCAGMTIGAGALLQYSDSLWGLASGILPTFLIIYAVIYTCFYIGSRHNVKKINEKLQAR